MCVWLCWLVRSTTTVFIAKKVRILSSRYLWIMNWFKFFFCLFVLLWLNVYYPTLIRRRPLINCISSSSILLSEAFITSQAFLKDSFESFKGKGTKSAYRQTYSLTTLTFRVCNQPLKRYVDVVLFLAGNTVTAYFSILYAG